jgi:hypothetical protein
VKRSEFFILLGLLSGIPSASAETEVKAPVDVPSPAVSAPVPAISPAPTTKSPLLQIPSKRVPVTSAKRGHRHEQKETEGTEALDRFKAETILKSVYSSGGKPLEVDPD